MHALQDIAASAGWALLRLLLIWIGAVPTDASCRILLRTAHCFDRCWAMNMERTWWPRGLQVRLNPRSPLATRSSEVVIRSPLYLTT